MIIVSWKTLHLYTAQRFLSNFSSKTNTLHTDQVDVLHYLFNIKLL